MSEIERQEIGLGAPDGTVGVANLVRFLRRRLLGIVAFAVALATLAALWTLLLGQRVYQASALVVVTPASYSSPLRPGTFSVYGYQEILQSDAVVERARAELVAQGSLTATYRLQAGRNLQSEIFVAQRDQTSLAPMLRLRATADTPERAAAIANAWAEAMIDETRDLTERSTMVSVSLVEARFAQAASELAALETARAETRIAFEGTFTEAAAKWESRLSAARRATEDLVASYQSETHEAVAAFAAANGLGDPAGPFPPDLAAALHQLVSLQTRLAQTLPYVVLERSVSDDALWQGLANGTPNLEDDPTPSLRLDDQEVNEVHTELSTRLADVELRVREGAARAGVDIRALSAALERARRDRAAGLAKLADERRLALDRLRAGREADLEGLLVRHRREMDEKNRGLAAAQSEYDDLAARSAQAALARSEAETTRDVTVGLPAVPPTRPVPRGLAFRVFVALVVGAMIGLAHALVREVDG